MSDFLELATDPRQYDGPVGWSHATNRTPRIRAALLGTVLRHAGDVNGAKVLDIGSGEGWLCDELTALGASTVGVEPSKKHVEAAREQSPGLDFRHAAFDDFETAERFDLVTGLMVVEHFGDLPKSFDRMKSMLKRAARLVIVSPAYNDTPVSRSGHKLEIQDMGEGMVAVRAHKTRRGLLHDVLRTPERIMADAQQAGLRIVAHEAIPARDWPGSTRVPPDRTVIQAFHLAA